MRSKFYTSTGSWSRAIVLFFIKHKPKFVYRTLLVCLFFSNAVSAQDLFMGLASNGGPNGKGIAFSIKSTGTDFNIMEPFADWGKNPHSTLLLGPDGSYYGTTTNGGVYGYGSIYKMSPSGVITLIKSFNLSVDGGYPYGRLTLAKDGNLYGTTSGGGQYSAGVIYRLTMAGIFSVVRSLSGAADGSNPRGQLVAATDGNMYGITYGGGTYGTGTIFRLTTGGIYTVLKSLNKPTDGGQCYGSLMQAADGNLYGMAYGGGQYNYGTIFKYSFTTGFAVIRHLNAVTDGSYTTGTLIQGKDTRLYGMMYSGGTYGNGTIFSISTGGVFTVLRHLRSGTDGSYPFGTLVENTDGAFYGVLPSGGAYGGGTIFKITKDKIFNVLRSLTPKTDGSEPKGGLMIGADGALYGCASNGGTNLYGTVFRLMGTTFTILNTFTGATVGNTPSGDLVKADDNALYGTTTYGGLYNYGTIFKICGGKTTVLKSFNRNADGGLPKGTLVQAPDGNLYGLASDGGLNGNGTIFRISKTGAFSVVRHLKGSTDGGYPNGSLILAKDGFLYGLASAGGATGAGTMFKVSTGNVFSVVKSFTAATDGSNPQGTLVQHPDGSIYGMTNNNGRIFKLSSLGVYSVVKTFSSATDGNSPTGNLLVGVDKNLYGTTSSGGTNGKGTIFRLTSAGAFSVMKHFNTTTDGQYPKGGLVQGTDGNLYGMTSTGGVNKGGTLFRITLANAFSVVKSFDLIKEGGSPLGGLLKYTGVVLIANPQTLSTTEDVAKAITLTGSGAATLIYNITRLPKNGKITGTGAAITYTPTLNFNGRDSFYFTVSVGCQTSAPAKVIVTTTAVNDAPVLATIGSKTIVKGTALKFTAIATNPDPGQTLTYSLITPPTGATINATTGAFSWTPAAAGTFSVKVRVTDNGSPVLYDEETVSLTATATLIGASAPAGNDLEVREQERKELNNTSTIFPNPAHEKLFIRLNRHSEKADVRVMDIKGMVVSDVSAKRVSGTQLELSVSALTPGTYLVSLTTEHGSETLRFVRN